MKRKPCCRESFAEGMAYCLMCGAPLLTDETTLVKEKTLTESQPPQPVETSRRSWYVGMILACLVVFAVVVASDYIIQQNIHQSVAQVAAPSPPSVASP